VPRHFSAGETVFAEGEPFLFKDHLGRPLDILRNYLWTPGVMLALVLPLHNEEGGRGWGVLMAAAIINWLFYSIVLFAIVFSIRKWTRKAKATSSSM
jgi:hypothetical protein